MADPDAPTPERKHQRWALGLSLALHLAAAGLLIRAAGPTPPDRPEPPHETVVYLADILSAEPPPTQPPPAEPKPAPPATPASTAEPESPAPNAPVLVTPQPGQAYMDAPPAPTAQEWAMAATYTLKNAKRYRYNWGQQVRSMMGPALEGPEQGAVRFRIEIEPGGQLAQLDTLWATSPAVEQRARQAVQRMPPLPSTPNGKPLVFEKTIVFDAFTAEVPPLYKDDCEPDPPQHGNRFAWDGHSPQITAAEAQTQPLDPAAYSECLKQLPQDSIEAEAASDERQQKQWASPTLGR